MRILIDYRPALRQKTGVGLWVAQLVEELAKHTATNKLDLTVFSSSLKDRFTRTLPATVKRVDRRIPVRMLNWLWHHRTWPAIESLTPGVFDVVHSPSPLLIPTRHAARIISIHDLDFLYHPERSVREVRRDYPALIRDHANRADGIVVPSNHTRNEVSRVLNLPTNRIVVCPNGAPNWLPRDCPPERGHLLFVGTINPRKNIDRLLEAYAQLIERRRTLPRLVLAGHATRESRPTLNRLTRPPLAGHVYHEGYVDSHRLRTLYEEALIVVLPSLDEGFGIPALEAMTLGVPVVAASRGALPEVLGNAGLLIDPLDVAELSSTLEKVLTDQQLYARLSAAGPVQARRFSWRASADALIRAYIAAIEFKRLRLGDKPDAYRN